MLLTKLKITAILILLIVFAGYGVGVRTFSALAEGQAQPPTAAEAKENGARPGVDTKAQLKVADHERLQGTWKLEKRRMWGEDMPASVLQLIFAKDSVEYQQETYFWEGTFKLGQSGEYKTLDIFSAGGTTPCLYRLEGEKLIVAHPNGYWGERPKDFNSTKDDNTKFIFTFAHVPVQKGPADDEAAQKAKMKRARLGCGASLHRLVLAMHKYIDDHNHFPPAATTDGAGKPLLSWRVALLPYLGEKELYEKFRQDEPWDSAHNRKLLPRMPKIYASVGTPTKDNHATFYQVFVGEDCVFEMGKKIGLQDIEDGTVNTLAIIEAGEAVPWTKPADLACDAGKPLPSLAGGMVHDGLVSFAFADSSVCQTRNTVDEKVLRPFILRNTGTNKDVRVFRK